MTNISAVMFEALTRAKTAPYAHLIGGFKVSLLKFSHLLQQLPVRVRR